MKKNIIALLLALLIILSNLSSVFALTLEYDGQQHEYTGALYTLFVNGRIIETPLEPIIFNDRAVVPVREVFEALGAEVGYENATKTVTVKTNTDTVILTIDENTAFVNGAPMAIPDGVTPKLIAKQGESAKTMVPVRFVSEALGLAVDFKAEQKAIFISQPAPTTPKPAPANKLTGIVSQQVGDGVIITVSANGYIEKMSTPTLTSANVLYADVFNVDYTLNNAYTIDAGGVKQVRFGQHADYSRIAVDLDNPTAYTMQLSADKQSIIISTVPGQSTNTNTQPSPAPAPGPTPKPENAAKKIVVLDAGHGGSDPGASGYYDGTKYNEKDLTLRITKKVEAILTAKGIPVLMTRSGDTYPTLDERPALANLENAALFVSIHINSVDNVPGANGAEVYYCTTNNGNAYGVTSQELASNLLNSVLASTGQKNRGVKSASHAVTRKSNMPAALYEVGFISNQAELKNMISDSFQQKVAAGLAEGIIKTWNKVTVPTVPITQTTEVTT